VLARLGLWFCAGYCGLPPSIPPHRLQHPAITPRRTRTDPASYRAPAARAACLGSSCLRLTGQPWAIVVAFRAFLLATPVWWLYIYVGFPALPLQGFTDFSLNRSDSSAWVPYVPADAWEPLRAGGMSGHLIFPRRVERIAQRSPVPIPLLACCAFCTACWPPSHTTREGRWQLSEVVLFGFQTWINNVQTLPSDYFPESRGWPRVRRLGGMGAGI